MQSKGSEVECSCNLWSLLPSQADEYVKNKQENGEEFASATWLYL